MWENVEQGGGMTELSYYEWNQSISISGSGSEGSGLSFVVWESESARRGNMTVAVISH